MGAENNSGSQFLRTHKAICNSLLELLQTSSFEKITVQDILESTPVSRTTFYKHFADKYAVAEELQREYLEFVDNLMKQVPKDTDTREEHVYFVQANVGRYRKMSDALSKIHTDTIDLKRMLKADIEKRYNDQFAQSFDLDKYQSELAAKIYAEAIVSYELKYYTGTSLPMQGENDYIGVMTAAFLAILEMDKDEFLKEYIRKKVDNET